MANQIRRHLLRGIKGCARVYWNRDSREFIVRLEGNPEADYETPDLADALGTARHMVGEESISA